MTLRRTLASLAKAIADEADQNDRLRSQLEAILGITPDGHPTAGTSDAGAWRKGGRRTPAVLDPVEVVRRSEAELRKRLASLDLEQLRDVVAQYGMDTGKLVMKWRDPSRVAERIVEMALARAKKGEAFRAG